MDRRRGYGNSYLQKRDPEVLSDLIPAFIRTMGLAPTVRTQLILEAWDNVSGAAPYTLSKYVKNGVLFCSISSSVVRNQLFFRKDAIVEEINRIVLNNPLMTGAKPGTKVLKSLILR
ncbi:MAG: DUF721 domain-containing protein [Candidatus Cryptobacteroides sp.]